jgi:hypothetical protein
VQAVGIYAVLGGGQQGAEDARGAAGDGPRSRAAGVQRDVQNGMQSIGVQNGVQSIRVKNGVQGIGVQGGVRSGKLVGLAASCVPSLAVLGGCCVQLRWLP